MTSSEMGMAPRSTRSGALRWLVSSMWGFWLLLLAVSFALATGIYYVWLRGNL